MREIAKLNFNKRDFIRKRTEALTKFRLLKQNFKKREKKVRAELEKVSKTWEELGQRFTWWQSLP